MLKGLKINMMVHPLQAIEATIKSLGDSDTLLWPHKLEQMIINIHLLNGSKEEQDENLEEIPNQSQTKVT